MSKDDDGDFWEGVGRSELSLCGDPIFAAYSIVLTTADVSG